MGKTNPRGGITPQGAESKLLKDDSANSGRGQGIALVLTGLGIGWLTGLSLSPVVGGVLASLLSVAGGAVAFLSGIQPVSDRLRVHNTWPVAMLVVSVAIGATAGLTARTFMDHYALPGETKASSGRKQSQVSKPRVQSFGLYGMTATACEELRKYEAQDRLKFGLLKTASPELRELIERIEGAEALQEIGQALCPE